MDFKIVREKSGISVKSYLLNEVGISSAMLKHLKFTDGGICVNGSHVTVRHLLSEGEILSIKSEDDGLASAEKILPVDLPLEIAYEDDDVVVPNKAPFMPTHPSHDHYEDTAANALCFKYKREGIPFVFRPVNRLDRNTSGLLLVAKNRMAAARLFESMKTGRIKKDYLALLDGVPKERCGEIRTYLKRTDESIIVRRVCREDEGGDLAITRYEVIAADKEGKHSLVLASPITGRTHQLRVHFSHIGCAIIGDDMYGEPSDEINRHALHAFRLSFPHPKDERRISITAFVPDDMKKLMRLLFTEDEILSAQRTFGSEQSLRSDTEI